jgi:hypothetical protein
MSSVLLRTARVRSPKPRRLTAARHHVGIGHRSTVTLQPQLRKEESRPSVEKTDETNNT